MVDFRSLSINLAGDDHITRQLVDGEDVTVDRLRTAAKEERQSGVVTDISVVRRDSYYGGADSYVFRHRHLYTSVNLFATYMIMHGHIWLVAWLSGEDIPWPIPDIWLTGDHFVGKLSAMGQPTRPTRPSIFPGVGIWLNK